MEQTVIHNELRLQQAQAIAHYGNCELDFSTGLGVWSDEACRIYGISGDNNIQSYQSWLSFIHPEDLEYVKKLAAGDKEALTNTPFHHRIIRKDGSVRHIFSQGHFEINKEGKLVGLYNVIHDVTETKQAEEALAQSEANLRQIMDLIPQSIFVKDYDGKLVFANKSYASLHGRQPNEMVNKTSGEVVKTKDELVCILEDREVISSGMVKTIPECVFTDNNGEAHLLHIVKVPFTVAGSNERVVLGILVDITQQKHAETERTKMIADIVQRNKDLEQFSYIISHNLRAPVANIIGATEVLQIEGLDEDDRVKLTEDLSLTVKKLDVVIRDLNHILQVRHKEIKAAEVVKFSEIMEDIKLSISDVIKSNNVQIISDFSSVDEVPAFKSYMYSIFFNLISNSIKYRQAGVTPVIKVNTRKVDGKILLVFSDNGLGIDLAAKGMQVFGLYKRFHHHVEGKGMGLFMVKTQVESMGGRITIESKVNTGTEFRIELEAR